jgi:hypothetical protein
MNSKVHSMELAPDVIAARRVLKVAEPAALPAFNLRVLVGTEAPALIRSLRSEVPGRRVPAIDWETASYIALWFCGLITIVLCLF